MGSSRLGDGTLLLAGELAAYDGPWVNPDDMRKLDGMVRYSQGTALDGLSLTGMAYSNKWSSTDQVPLRAITSGQIGRVLSSRLAKSSGHAPLDQDALALIRRASPFPSPPASVSDDLLTVIVPIGYDAAR